MRRSKTPASLLIARALVYLNSHKRPIWTHSQVTSRPIFAALSSVTSNVSDGSRTVVLLLPHRGAIMAKPRRTGPTWPRASDGFALLTHQEPRKLLRSDGATTRIADAAKPHEGCATGRIFRNYDSIGPPVEIYLLKRGCPRIAKTDYFRNSQ